MRRVQVECSSRDRGRAGRIVSGAIRVSIASFLVAAVCSHVAFAQLVTSSRSPVALGTVVDNAPFNWLADAEAIEPEVVIGNQGSTIRKAVLEFDISDLKPGVVESARLTGQTKPLESSPIGTRQLNFHVNAGNGVLDVGDNNQSGTFHVGWFEHAAGSTTSYNQTITRQFRYQQYRGAEYLRQVIQPGDSPQGWDQVSLSPGPKLVLELRPTTAETEVYYQPPVAAGAARAQNGGAFNVNASATRADVMNWTYAPFEQGRGLMEFDLSSIPRSAKILWAKIDVHIDGLQGSIRPPYGPNLQIAGYFGDGSVASSDLAAGAVWLGSTGEMRSVGVASWDIGADFVKSVLLQQTHLGLRFSPGQAPEYQAGITLRESRFPEIRPHLAIAWEAPEPATIWSLLVALTSGAIRRGKRRR